MALHRRPWALPGLRRTEPRTAAAPVPNATPAVLERAAGSIAGGLPLLGRRDPEPHQILHTRRG